jgi:hypothetical protein
MPVTLPVDPKMVSKTLRIYESPTDEKNLHTKYCADVFFPIPIVRAWDSSAFREHNSWPFDPDLTARRYGRNEEYE